MRVGWETRKLKEIGVTQTGTTPSTKEKSNYGYYIPFIKPAHFKEDGSIIYDDIGLSEIGIKKGRLIEKNSILMVCIGATIGKTGFTSIPVSCNQQINTFTPKKGFYPRYFYYALSNKQFFNTVLRNASQATLPIINKTKWENLEVSYPTSIDEQQRIVAILDKAFEAIDQAKVNVEKNLQNAKELCQSKLNKVFSQKGEGWEEKKLRNVCTLQRGYDLPTRLRTNGKYPLISSSGVSDSHSEYKVEGPGVVTGRSGSIGNVFYIEEHFWPLNTSLYVKNFHGNFEKYVYYLLSNFDLKRYASGAGVPTLNRNFVHDELVMTTNSIDEQVQIAQMLDDLVVNVEALGVAYGKKLDELKELKKSILQKAFSGELTSASTKELAL